MQSKLRPCTIHRQLLRSLLLSSWSLRTLSDLNYLSCGVLSVIHLTLTTSQAMHLLGVKLRCSTQQLWQGNRDSGWRCLSLNWYGCFKLSFGVQNHFKVVASLVCFHGFVLHHFLLRLLTLALQQLLISTTSLLLSDFQLGTLTLRTLIKNSCFLFFLHHQCCGSMCVYKRYMGQNSINSWVCNPDSSTSSWSRLDGWAEWVDWAGQAQHTVQTEQPKWSSK